jgi:hypothetical protein
MVKKNKAQSNTGSTATTTSAKSTFPPNLLNQPYSKSHNSKPSNNQSVTALVPSAVFVSRNFLTQNECNNWIKHVEETGFENLCSPRTHEFAQRECGRISKTDWDMADRLYERMQSMMKEITKQITIPSSDRTYAPITCNGNLRLYKYEKNMSFGRHYDGSARISRFKGGNTEITVLVYLTSCKGGATRFYLPSSSKKGRNKKAKSENSDGIAFEPEAGAILMHLHGDRCLEHEADPVLDGVKYVLRTDIVYAPAQS